MIKWDEKREWISDNNNNKCSVEYFGSEEVAEKALLSLKNCENCTNCSRCSDCSDCSDCSGCSYCSRCSDCSGCSGCSYCSRCSDCSYCSDCSGCSYCSDCSDCSDCSRCSGCSRCSYCSRCSDCSDCSGCSGCSYCSRCSDCSRCSYCSDCSGCSGCSYCSDLKNYKPVEAIELKIPKIENIHQSIFAAVSQPNALAMDSWHTCGTTHCRAGWVVTLAGEEGKKLEEFYNTELAAALIYRESSSIKVSAARFYDGNEAAMQDMKRCAELEKAQI